MGHGHSHAPAPGGSGRGRLTAALCITLGIFLVQVVGAVVTGSLALLFDTVHVLTDAAGLAMALFAAILTERPATSRRTWGWKRVEVLAAALQSAVLLAVGVFVVVQAVGRLIDPEPVAGAELVVFGVVGLIGNVVALAVMFGGSKTLNMKAAFLEVLNDALGSVAVIVSAVIIVTTGWVQADAIVAMLIGVLIMPRAVTILREAFGVLLESAPPGLDLDDVRRHIEAHPHVLRVHDLHASRISTDLPILSVHVVLDDECFGDGHSAELLGEIQDCIAGHFEVSIEHSTIQLEPLSHYRREAEGFPV